MKRTPEKMKEIGARIRKRRQSIGLTGEQLADKIGLHKTTIHRYETGEMQEIKDPILDALADALYVSREWLLGETADMHPKAKKTDVLMMIDELKKTLNGPYIVTFGDEPATREALDTIITSLDVIVSTAEQMNSKAQRQQALRSRLMAQQQKQAAL